MKQKSVYGGVALAAMALLLVGGVSAFGGFDRFSIGAPLTEEEKDNMEAFRDQVRTAIENEDYAAWYDLMESRLTQEDFEMIVEQHDKMQEIREISEQMRQAKEDGDTETFEELRLQLQELMPQANGYRAQEMQRGRFGGSEMSGNAQ